MERVGRKDGCNALVCLISWQSMVSLGTEKGGGGNLDGMREKERRFEVVMKTSVAGSLQRRVSPVCNTLGGLYRVWSTQHHRAGVAMLAWWLVGFIRN